MRNLLAIGNNKNIMFEIWCCKIEIIVFFFCFYHFEYVGRQIIGNILYTKKKKENRLYFCLMNMAKVENNERKRKTLQMKMV